MNIFYEKPTDINIKTYGEREDVNGRTFWIDWSAWISATKIDSEDAIKLLPYEIAEFVSKWEKEIQRLKEEKYSLDYPIKLATIYFIYKDIVYVLKPNAFASTKENLHKTFNPAQELFEGVHEIIEKDLQDIGCIYTWYNDFLD